MGGIPVATSDWMTNVYRDPVGMAIIAAATEVHRTLGPGLYERVYQLCLLSELRERGVPTESEVALPVFYKGLRVDCGFRIDFVVSTDVIVEVKCVERLLPIHTAQILTYLRLTGARQAFLINFNGVTLRDGLRSYLGTGATRSHSS